METGRLKVMLMAAGMTVTLLALVAMVVGTMTDDADAARRAQLKTLWAVVNSDGTIERGKGVTGKSKPDTGDYAIAFNRDVSGCASSATLQNNSGFVFLDTVRPSDPLTQREVGVTTLDRAGVVRDTAFHLVVNC